MEVTVDFRELNLTSVNCQLLTNRPDELQHVLERRLKVHWPCNNIRTVIRHRMLQTETRAESANMTRCTWEPPEQVHKTSSGFEIANVNFYAVCPEATRIR